MQPNDARRFRDLLRGMGRMYGAEPDALTLDAYWIALKCWGLQDFEAACAQLMQTAKFMPRPAEFTELRNAGDLTAGEAFAIAMSVARHCSQHGSPSADEPRVDAAARACGGYFAMGQTETEKIGFLERRFSEHFESISEREEIREALPQIAGPSRARVSGPRGLVEISDETYNGRQS